MRERNAQENELPVADYPLEIWPGEHSRNLFLATFPEGYTPKVDTRTPSAVASGLSQQEWSELNA